MATAIRDENMKLGKQFKTWMDTIALSVADKISSIEDTLNQKFASFETQLREHGHPAPSPASGADKNFEVIFSISEIA